MNRYRARKLAKYTEDIAYRALDEKIGRNILVRSSLRLKRYAL